MEGDGRQRIDPAIVDVSFPGDLLMTDWKKLRHAQGSAEDLPKILKEIKPDRKAPVWDELWERVCHQGTTYSASPAILPFLLTTASGWAPSERAMALSLAGAIVAAKESDLAGYESSVEALRLLAVDTLKSRDLSRSDRVYVMQSVLAMEGDRLWGRVLDNLNHGEFSGLCSACRTDLYLAVGEFGFFCTTEEWVGNPDARRTPILPGKAEELTPPGKWLCEVCVNSGDPALGEWICHLFGASTCPACGEPLDVASAVAEIH
jgi:hypothetical protein